MGKPQLRDLAPGTETFLKDVLEGLSQDPKTLPCTVFKGSKSTASSYWRRRASRPVWRL